MKKFFVVLVSLVIMIATPMSTYALTEAQLEMFSQNNILFYDPDDNCVSASAAGVGNSDGSDVYMIGDSITVLSQNEIEAEMPKVTLNARSGIYFSHDLTDSNDRSGVSRISEMGGQSILVFALGSNGGIDVNYDDTAKFFEATSGKDIKVILMTIYYKDKPNSNQTVKTNEKVKELAANYSNITYIDWHRAASSNPDEYISDDNVHPTSAGRQRFAKLVKEAVDNVSVMNIPTNYGSGDDARILSAKNADQDVFNVSDSSEWSARWSDSNTEAMARVLSHYGDLAYQLGDVAGIPWVAVIVQMRYEDPYSRCGHNNFWGNGCSGDHTGTGQAHVQGANLGEGFSNYNRTLHNSMFTPYNEQVHFLGETDPKVYLEKIGPMWVQGSSEGAGYGSIEGMKNSVDALMSFIDTNEGQAIVNTFGNYHGTYTAYSASFICQEVSAVSIGEPVFYSQYDPLWKDISYDYQNCGTIGSAGCGPASLASIIATLTGNTSVTPVVIAEKAMERGYRGCRTDCSCHGSSHAITELAADYGLKVKNFGRQLTIDDVSNYLRQGWMFHVVGHGSNPFSDGGHFIGIRGVTSDGKWLIFDSGRDGNSEKEWDPSDVYPIVDSEWRGVSK